MSSIASEIVRVVIAAAGAGRLPAGAKLGEDDLARIFGTSRTFVRLALKELAYLGIVSQIPSRGAFMAMPSEQDIADCYAARRLIETAIVADVARNCTANDIRRLREHVRRQRETRTPDRAHSHVQLLGAFHVEIAKLGGNRVLCEILEMLTARTAVMATIYEPPGHGCGIDDHEALIDALAAGDADRAMAVMNRHLSTNLERLQAPSASPPKVDLDDALRPYRPAA